MGLKNKKIAVLCNYELLMERVGGMDYFFWEFDRKCKQNNISVDWFFPNTATHGEYPQLTIHASSYSNLEFFFLEFCQMKSGQEYEYVITHFVELCTPILAKIKKLTKAKIIAVDHNPRPLEGYPLSKRIKKRIKGILFGHDTDVFVGVSQYTSNEIIKDFGFQLKSKTITIYNGVQIDEIITQNSRSSAEPVFLVASHLRESKGIQDLIEAVYRLSEDIKGKIRIDIYGDGPFLEFLLQKIQQRKLGHVFIFKGSQRNLKEIYCKYDYMLQPTRMECFSLSILESLAANVPVITTNVGGNEEAVSDGVNGFIFRARDIGSLSKILKDVYLGNEKITVDTRKLIEDNFNLEQMVQKHFNLLV